MLASIAVELMISHALDEPECCTNLQMNATAFPQCAADFDLCCDNDFSLDYPVCCKDLYMMPNMTGRAPCLGRRGWVVKPRENVCPRITAHLEQNQRMIL